MATSNNLIVMLASGWGLVGEVEDWHAERMTLARGYVLRRWGTTRGIGQLTTGPTKESIIDPLPTRVTIPTQQIAFTLEVSGWEAAFAQLGR